LLGEDIPFPAGTGDSQQSNKKYPILCETDERVLIFLNDLHEWVLSANQVEDLAVSLLLKTVLNKTLLLL
jgi:hypothetical protein